MREAEEEENKDEEGEDNTEEPEEERSKKTQRSTEEAGMRPARLGTNTGSSKGRGKALTAQTRLGLSLSHRTMVGKEVADLKEQEETTKRKES